MNTHWYQTDEVAFEVPDGFVDDSSNLMEWPAEGGGIALLLRRRPIAEGSSFAAMTKSYSAELRARLTGFREEGPIPFEVPGPHHALCFRFREDARVIYQVHLMLDRGDKALFFIWGGPAQHRALVDALAKQSAESLMIREHEKP